MNFHYFTEGTDKNGADLDAMTDAVEFVRGMNRRAGDVIKKELRPGESVGTCEQVRRWGQDEAWGHHASRTCPMGRPDEPAAVVDSRFRVCGVRRAACGGCGLWTPPSSPSPHSRILRRHPDLHDQREGR
ncbi:GMC oxidoreductase [Streptomyces sp. NPDC005474]|uniref:GMC oxidoreductase n=1 Tax=Streptomyces sp. NPDC005474 TaxID=3154878 RepID=UPI003453C1A2